MRFMLRLLLSLWRQHPGNWASQSVCVCFVIFYLPFAPISTLAKCELIESQPLNYRLLTHVTAHLHQPLTEHCQRCRCGQQRENHDQSKPCHVQFGEEPAGTMSSSAQTPEHQRICARITVSSVDLESYCGNFVHWLRAIPAGRGHSLSTDWDFGTTSKFTTAHWGRWQTCQAGKYSTLSWLMQSLWHGRNRALWGGRLVVDARYPQSDQMPLCTRKTRCGKIWQTWTGHTIRWVAHQSTEWAHGEPSSAQWNAYWRWSPCVTCQHQLAKRSTREKQSKGCCSHSQTSKGADFAANAIETSFRVESNAGAEWRESTCQNRSSSNGQPYLTWWQHVKWCSFLCQFENYQITFNQSTCHGKLFICKDFFVLIKLFLK